MVGKKLPPLTNLALPGPPGNQGEPHESPDTAPDGFQAFQRVPETTPESPNTVHDDPQEAVTPPKIVPK
eukprot:6368483-Pyramimonas_sp.AAC.1